MGRKVAPVQGRKQNRYWVLVVIVTVAAALFVWLALRRNTAPGWKANREPINPDWSPRVSSPALQAAIVKARQAVRKDPSSAEQVGHLGMLYHANDRLEEAGSCYRSAARLSPQDHVWRYYLALLAETRGDEEEAIHQLKSVVRMEPEYVHAKSRLGKLLFRAGQIEEARKFLAEALEKDPLHPDACLTMARLLTWEKNWEKVIQTLEPMLRERPLFAPALRLLARACRQMKRPFPFQELPDESIVIEEIADEPLLDALYDRSALAFSRGEARRGKELAAERCTRCHSEERIQKAGKNRQQWLRTIRRMQKMAGPEWLNDRDAADILAWLQQRGQGT